MIEHSTLTNEIRTQQYFAHPYSSWERGSNENVNGIIRWFIPKRSNISKISTEQIKEVEDWINNLPRRILNAQSAKTASARAEAA
jgi:IS30 family transposase